MWVLATQRDRRNRRHNQYFRSAKIAPSRDPETLKTWPVRCLASPTFSQVKKILKLDTRNTVSTGMCLYTFWVVPRRPDKSDHVSVGRYPFALRRATPEDLPDVRRLVRDVAKWLRTSKDTDQWAKPWPTREGRDQRLLAGLEKGETWIVWDGDTPAATVTIATRANTAVWSNPAHECNLSEPAVYVHRLITARDYAGRGLGAELIDWAGLRGQRLYDAKWIRIDVWSSNTALHDY